MRARLLLPGMLLVLSGVGCSGSDGAPGTQVTRTPSPSASPCPVPTAPPAAWPSEVPTDLPKPVGAVITDVKRTPGGVTVVTFSVASSLRDGVLYVVREFPKHGYQIGRGDAEVSEADAPFQRGTLRGLVRILSRERCQTLWLMAVGQSGGVPFAPNYSPPPSSSPLPFG